MSTKDYTAAELKDCINMLMGMVDRWPDTKLVFAAAIQEAALLDEVVQQTLTELHAAYEAALHDEFKADPTWRTHRLLHEAALLDEAIEQSFQDKWKRECDYNKDYRH